MRRLTALAAIAVALAARFASTIVPVTLLRRNYDFLRGTVIVLVWGGLRGGISIALAFSLPETPFKAALLGDLRGRDLHDRRAGTDAGESRHPRVAGV